MSSHTLTCPQCGAPVTFRSSFCAYCRAPLAAALAPKLERGAPLALNDLKGGITLPFAQHAVPRPGRGLEFTLPETGAWREPVGPLVRDSVARVAAVCHDAHGSFGVGARCHRLGSVIAGYRVVLRPAYRDFSVVRFASYPGGVYVANVLPPRPSEMIAGVGQRNTVEIRCADSLFTVLVNDRHAHTFEDAHFVFGHDVWLVGAAQPGARVTLESVDVWALG